MLRLLSLFGAVVLLTHCAGAPKSLDVDSDEPLNGAVRKPVKKEPGKSEILLDGRIYKVRWGDGDMLFDLFTRSRAVRRGIIDAGQDTDAPDFGRRS